MRITIKSSIEGFRRAGMAHSTQETTHPSGTFTTAQIEQLKAEPRLSVTVEENQEPPTKDQPSTPDKSDKTSGQLDDKRVHEFVEHIKTLDRNNAALWKQDGSPAAKAFPNDATKEEREAAYKVFLAQVEPATSAASTNETNQESE